MAGEVQKPLRDRKVQMWVVKVGKVYKNLNNRKLSHDNKQSSFYLL